MRARRTSPRPEGSKGDPATRKASRTISKANKKRANSKMERKEVKIRPHRGEKNDNRIKRITT